MEQLNLLDLGPEWFRMSGHDVKLIGADAETRVIELGSDSVEVTIESLAQRDVDPRERDWSIDWFARHSEQRMHVGRRILTTQQMVEAFGLDEDDWSQTRQEKEAFIRSGEYLNVPCRGMPGDETGSVVSLRVTSDLRGALYNLMMTA